MLGDHDDVPSDYQANDHPPSECPVATLCPLCWTSWSYGEPMPAGWDDARCEHCGLVADDLVLIGGDWCCVPCAEHAIERQDAEHLEAAQ